MHSSWSNFFQGALDSRRAAHGFRQRRAGLDFDSADDWLDFGSNDYLGLRHHPSVISVLSNAESTGSGSSPLLFGYSRLQQSVEQKIAELTGSESALVFASGYACNVGVLACLATRDDLILSDQLNHASLIDGCRLSKATTQVFSHSDVQQVADYLRDHRGRYQRVVLVTESVFSMDGDFSPLNDLADVCERHGCGLVVDEAHAFGVYGDRGSGRVEELGLGDRVLLKLGTLSKSVGAVGGYAAGSQLLVDYLINFCRSFMFSTAPAIPNLHAVRSALDQVESMSDDRARLRELSAGLRDSLAANGWQVDLSADRDLVEAHAPRSDVERPDSPIVPIWVGESKHALELSQRLLEQNVYVPAIRPPTVPEGTSRLRVSLSAQHSDADLRRLVKILGKAD
ncbi:MAG: aminotransferase class I/II-fold pyridoxal phosphate-dependent enzyme [Pirellulaceae bacterium]